MTKSRLTNTEKVLRSLNLSMRDLTTDEFHGMSQFDKNTGLTRRQWSDGIQTNIRAGRISKYAAETCNLPLDKGMFRLIRKERYIDIPNNKVNKGDTVIAITNGCSYLAIFDIPEPSHSVAEKMYLKVISEDEYQELKQKEYHKEPLPDYVTKAPDRSVLPNRFKIDCKDETEKVQKILFELGCDWNGPSNLILYPYKRLYIIDKLIKTYLIKHDFVESKYPELTLSEFYELVGKEKPESTKDSKSEGQDATTDHGESDENDHDIISPFKPKKTGKATLIFKGWDAEPKVGDYVRLKSNFVTTSGDNLSNKIVIVRQLLADAYFSFEYNNNIHAFYKLKFIKKIINLPERFRIDCKGETKKVQKILFELGCEWRGREMVIHPYKRLSITNKKIMTGWTKHDIVGDEYPELTVSEFYELVGLDVPKTKPIEKQPVAMEMTEEALRAAITTLQHPLIEIKSRIMWFEDRLTELNKVLKYYIETNIQFPADWEWVKERNKILDELNRTSEI